MKKLSFLFPLLIALFFAKSADASDIYISNCTAKPVRNPATNSVDVELKAEVCTTDTNVALGFKSGFILTSIRHRLYLPTPLILLIQPPVL
jgi:hypothetical protein